jgi:hypothetical protein
MTSLAHVRMEAAMAKVSQTLQVLMAMRDELRGMRGDLGDVKAELRDFKLQTNDRFERLDATMAEQFIGIAAVLRDTQILLRDRLDQRDRVEDHERRIRSLERRRRIG